MDTNGGKPHMSKHYSRSNPLTKLIVIYSDDNRLGYFRML